MAQPASNIKRQISIEQRDGVEDQDRKIDFLLMNARKLMDNKESTLATNIYIHVLKLDKRNPEALRGLGMCLENKNELAKSEICYRRYAKLTQSPDSYTKLATIYLKLRQDQKAIQCLEKALKLEPVKDEARFEIYNHLGNSYLKGNEIQQAEKYYFQALDLKPHSDRVMINLGTLYFQMGNMEKALKFYRSALGINPRSSKAICGLGILLQEQKEWADALKLYTQALDLDWDNLVAVNGMIRCGQQLNEFSIIEKYLKRYLFHYPSNVAIIYCLAGNFFHQKKYDYCREELLKIDLLDPYHEAALELKALLEKAKKKQGGEG